MTEHAIYDSQRGFAPVSAADEDLHPVAGVHDYTFGETSYHGFNVPDAGIGCEIYHWFHPVLGVTSGGLLLWQGEKLLTAQAECLDYRNFLPPVTGLADVTYPTGVRVEVRDPLQAIGLSYASADGRFAFDVESRALMPAAGRLDGLHFAQAMRSTGTLTFDGTEHRVESTFTRDRSWGRPRPEGPLDEPPLTWMGAVFGEDLAIHLTAHDGADGLRWGYVWRDGELREPVALRKATRRSGPWAVGCDIELTDSSGDEYRLTGTAVARLPMAFWPNMLTQLVLMRYELIDGRVAHGDYQDVSFGRLPA